MNNKERIANLEDKKYQELFGVKKIVFDMMLKILEADYQKKHERGGRPPKLRNYAKI